MFFSCLNKFHLFITFTQSSFGPRRRHRRHSLLLALFKTHSRSSLFFSTHILIRPFNMTETEFFYGTRINYDDIYNFNMFSFFFYHPPSDSFRIFNSLIGSRLVDSTIVCLCLETSPGHLSLSLSRDDQIHDTSLRTIQDSSSLSNCLSRRLTDNLTNPSTNRSYRKGDGEKTNDRASVSIAVCVAL